MPIGASLNTLILHIVMMYNDVAKGKNINNNIAMSYDMYWTYRMSIYNIVL